MDKSTGSEPRNAEGNPQREGLHKRGVLQHPGPGRAFKGLEVAERYCRRDSIGDRFSQGWSHLLGLVSQADAPSLEATPYGSSATGTTGIADMEGFEGSVLNLRAIRISRRDAVREWPDERDVSTVRTQSA